MRTNGRRSAHVGPRIWLAVLVACLVSREAAAQPYSVRHLEPEIESVISTGTWKTSSAEGTFRLIVVAGNREHGSHTFVQWIVPSPPPGTTTVIRTVDLNEREGVYSVTNPRLSRDARGRTLVTVTARTNDPSAPTRTLTFELRGPGYASLRH
jgi:hypothetical protein